MGTIKIRRTKEYNNGFRNIKIFIDGEPAGTISNGETKEFITTPGQHTLTAKIDWASSPDLLVDINENEVKTLKLGSNSKNNWLISVPFVLGIIILHFILSRTIGFNYIGFLLIPTLFIMIYQLSVGRKRQLVLKEDYGIR